MFPHARKGHVEPLGKGRDRSVRTPELLQNAASGGVRERAERGIEVVLEILNHVVQYTPWRDGMQWGAERPLRCRGGESPLGLPRSDRRHHLYLIGKTGTGKSTPP